MILSSGGAGHRLYSTSLLRRLSLTTPLCLRSLSAYITMPLLHHLSISFLLAFLFSTSNALPITGPRPPPDHTLTLFHATCNQYAKSIMGKIDLSKSDHSGDFNYKRPFRFFIPSHRCQLSYRRFLSHRQLDTSRHICGLVREVSWRVCCRACVDRNCLDDLSYILMGFAEYHWDPKNLRSIFPPNLSTHQQYLIISIFRVLHLNNTEEAKEVRWYSKSLILFPCLPFAHLQFCWDSEIIHDKLQSNPPGHLTPEEEKIKQEFDSHDMIWGWALSRSSAFWSVAELNNETL